MREYMRQLGKKMLRSIIDGLIFPFKVLWDAGRILASYAIRILGVFVGIAALVEIYNMMNNSVIGIVFGGFALCFVVFAFLKLADLFYKRRKWVCYTHTFAKE